MCAENLKKTLNTYKNPQLKKRSTAVALSLVVNGTEYLCDKNCDSTVEGAAAAGRGSCLWDYVLSDAGQDCFPLWFEVEEEGRKSVVMGAVLYFPIGEHSEEETAPRREVRVDMPTNSAESELKFATMWMGRWLPGESFVPPFMTYDNHKRPMAPARAYRRAFGFMFLDRTFRPQQNKVRAISVFHVAFLPRAPSRLRSLDESFSNLISLPVSNFLVLPPSQACHHVLRQVAIEPNRSLWLSLRREMDQERNFVAYDTWLLECNKRYDHEVLFDTDPSHVMYDEDRGMTRHKSIILAGIRFKVGDKVKIVRKGAKESAAFFSEVREFWQDGHHAQCRKDGFVSIAELDPLSLGGADAQEAKEMRFSQISMSKITLSKWKEESLRLSKHVVVDIAWENNLRALCTDDAKQGCFMLEAGTVLRNQAVVCLNTDGKPVAAASKGSAGGAGPSLDVLLVVKTPDLRQDVMFAGEVRDSDARTEGAKRFEFAALVDGDQNSLFTIAGRYMLEFSLRRAKAKGEAPSHVVKTVSYQLAVLPGEAKSLVLINREVACEDCPIDAPLPKLSFQILDGFRNTVEPSKRILDLNVSLDAPKSSRIHVGDDFSYEIGGDHSINVFDLNVGKVCGKAVLGRYSVGVSLTLAPLAESENADRFSAKDKHAAMSPEDECAGQGLLASKLTKVGKERAAVLPQVLEATVALPIIHGQAHSLALVFPGATTTSDDHCAPEMADSRAAGSESGGERDVEGVLSLANMTYLTKLEYVVKDSAGNVCTTFEGWVLVVSPALEERMHVRVARGVATFSQRMALQLRSPIFKKIPAACDRKAFCSQDAAAVLESLPQGAGGVSKRGRGGRGKKGDGSKKKSSHIVVVKDAGGFFLHDRDFIMPGDFVLKMDTPAQVLQIYAQEADSEVVLRCLRASTSEDVALVRAGGSSRGRDGLGDGCSVVSSKRAAPQVHGKRVVAASSLDVPDQTLKLHSGLIRSRSYVMAHAADFEKSFGKPDERFLDDAVFVLASDSPAHCGVWAGIPSVPLDAFVVQGQDEPPTDMSLLGQKLKLHTRTNVVLHSSNVPRTLDLVAILDQGSHQVAVKSVLNAGISGKPGQLLEGLQLEMRDEAGLLCSDAGSASSAQKASFGEGHEDDGEGWEVSCSWSTEPMAVLKYENKRVVLPALRVPEDMPELDCTTWLKVDEDTVLEAHFKVKVETGPPAKLDISMDGAQPASSRGAPAEVHIGNDCAFRVSVLDERGARIEGDTDTRHGTATGRLMLQKVQMSVSDESGKVMPILVRHEDYERSTQTYVQNDGPQAELDDEGNFWLRCIRLQGQVGPIVVRIEAQVQTEHALTSKDGEQISEFVVNGQQEMLLCVGKPAALVLQGRKMKRRGAGGVGTSTSQAMHSQAPEVFIRCQSFVQLDPLVISVADECGNLIENWKGKVLLDFKGSGVARAAVVSSRKSSGLPAEQMLHLEKVDGGGMQLLGLTFKESGSYSASFRSLGLPDVPVWFEVAAGNVVTSIDLNLPDDVDLSLVPLGARLRATLRIDTEDGAALTEVDKTAITCNVLESLLPLMFLENSAKACAHLAC